MRIYDFEYDGIKLSDKGYMICTLDGSGLDSIETNSSRISFTTIPVMQGRYNEFISSSYEECVTAVFCICKNPCRSDVFDSFEINLKEVNDLALWLNRRTYHILKIENDSYDKKICFDASFNITKKEINGKIYALELEMITNRPHAYLEMESVSLICRRGETYSFDSISTDEGIIYPDTRIVILQDGDLSIYNATDGKSTEIKNCTANEILTLNYPVITSSNNDHKINKDFNWNYLRICNAYNNKTNIISTSLYCQIIMKYYPVIKIGI